MGSCVSIEEGIQQPEIEGVCGVAAYSDLVNSVLHKSSDAQETCNTSNKINAVIISKNIKDLRQNPGNSNVDIFTYEEMMLSTKQFRPDLILGEGGFGSVYKGVIDENVRPGYKSTNVAIKELDPEGMQGDQEWLAEVNYLGQLQHPNLVKLIGYCCEGDHRLLVYEYMATGSLEKQLFSRVLCTLTWSRRMKIALDAAKGLAFLHSAERSIIYRDFKTSNILLDADFNAKLSDFGLAKDGPLGDQTHVSTRVMGTYGYAAPEYVMTGHLTARSDVYGFGVVLLEMLIGRRAVDKNRPSREHNLVEWARPLLNHHKKLFKILDPKLEGQYSNKIMTRVANLAYQCLSQNPKSRPLMSQVVEYLEALQTRAKHLESLLNNNGGGGIVTLYEAPKKTMENENPLKCESQRDAVGVPVMISSRCKNGRGKSEPTNEFDLSRLYEAPKKTMENENPLKCESQRDAVGVPEMISSRCKNGRSKSEPPNEFDLSRL